VVRYLVRRDGALLDSTANTSYSDTLVSSNTTYQYTVEARTSVGVLSGPSAAVTVTTLAPAPTGLVATAAGVAGVALTWDFVAGIPGYRVYRDGAVLPGIVSDTAFVDSGLDDATRYSYSVTALSVASVESARSAPASAVTDPLPPSGLGAQTSQTAVLLSWSAGGPEVVQYLVRRDGALLDSTANISYNDTLVSSNTSYRYTVEARTSVDVLSGPSPAVTATTRPDQPGSLTATPVSDTRIELSWTAPSGQIGQYRVTRAGLDTLIATTSFNDSGLTPATTYDYQVSAFGSTGLEGPAAGASATTLPATTGGLVVVTQTTGFPTASYPVVVEGPGGFRETRAMDATDREVFSSLVPGLYQVILQGIPDMCTVAPPNPRTETVQVGVETETIFVVTCSEDGSP
jgi:chitodextrinase